MYDEIYPSWVVHRCNSVPMWPQISWTNSTKPPIDAKKSEIAATRRKSWRPGDGDRGCVSAGGVAVRESHHIFWWSNMAIENAQLNIGKIYLGKSSNSMGKLMEIIHGYVWFHRVRPGQNSHKIGLRKRVKIEGPPSQEIWTCTVSSASLTLVSSSDSNISHETQAFWEWVGYQQIPCSTSGRQSETDCWSIFLSKESGKSTNPKLHRSTPRVSLCHWPKRGGTAARPSGDLPSCEDRGFPT